jgi:hypothetical protein
VTLTARCSGETRRTNGCDQRRRSRTKRRRHRPEIMRLLLDRHVVDPMPIAMPAAAAAAG